MLMDDHELQTLGKCLSYISLGALAGIAACCIRGCVQEEPDRTEPGYVMPTKARIESRDLRNDNHRQTVLEYDGRSYLFKVDTDGQPYAEPYRVVPQATTAKIVPLTKADKEPEVSNHGR
jgi:hypothetical protein